LGDVRNRAHAQVIEQTFARARGTKEAERPPKFSGTLELAVRDRIFIIPHQPHWDPIRTEPRFQALMRATGL